MARFRHSNTWARFRQSNTWQDSGTATHGKIQAQQHMATFRHSNTWQDSGITTRDIEGTTAISVASKCQWSCRSSGQVYVLSTPAQAHTQLRLQGDSMLYGSIAGMKVTGKKVTDRKKQERQLTRNKVTDSQQVKCTCPLTCKEDQVLSSFVQ